MKIIKPSYEIISEVNGLKLLRFIEFVGRKCYKSEDKITSDSCEKFIKMLIERGHESVLEHEKISVLFICDRGISHEIVRHRLASFSQESTRYCNYSKGKFGNELTFIDIRPHVNDDMYESWLSSLLLIETYYFELLEKGATPQIARDILPTSLKTELVVTANLREWRTIFKQRTAQAAHPQMRELMQPLLDEIKTLVPIVFDDITY